MVLTSVLAACVCACLYPSHAIAYTIIQYTFVYQQMKASGYYTACVCVCVRAMHAQYEFRIAKRAFRKHCKCPVMTTRELKCKAAWPPQSSARRQGSEPGREALPGAAGLPDGQSSHSSAEWGRQAARAGPYPGGGFSWRSALSSFTPLPSIQVP